MTKLSERILSIREQVGVEYTKPDKELATKYSVALRENEHAMEYLMKERGLSLETIEHFKLGYDSYRDAISIPIFKRGELVNIKYRFINPKTIKYSGEKNAESWIYNEDGLKAGKAKGSVIIVEGEFDLMSVWQAGSVNVVSPSAGKEAFGSWIEYIDEIPKVYIAYDNDIPGKEAGSRLAERIGFEKCNEIMYPDGIKDANEFFKSNDRNAFIKLAKDSKPYYTHQFKGLGDVIQSIQEDTSDTLRSRLIPLLRLKENAVITLSADTNIGKSTFCLNLVDEMTQRGIPCLVLPFEDGIEGMGQRFLQVKFDLDEDAIEMQTKEQWDRIIDKCVDLPLYFAHPSKDDAVETIVKAKRYFDTKIVIVDHIHYMLKGSANLQSDIAEKVKELRTIANKYGIIIVIVAHIRKLNNPGGWKEQKEPGLDDLKDSSSLKQDVPIVIMLSKTEDGKLKVNPLKAKGKAGIGYYNYNVFTGKIGEQVDEF